MKIFFFKNANNLLLILKMNALISIAVVYIQFRKKDITFYSSSHKQQIHYIILLLQYISILDVSQTRGCFDAICAIRDGVEPNSEVFFLII